ncbi:hypothetical protein EYF80_044052 [Liparis tanakae]|uniref:Uncharacterized protein n=1 Tax=Liparis tanakae TaxID=230148 RepID=A0A4Z2FZF6_9TELE|nr:hypothetical protein EYF80_044052 [Liparis tanakae]
MQTFDSVSGSGENAPSLSRCVQEARKGEGKSRPIERPNGVITPHAAGRPLKDVSSRFHQFPRRDRPTIPFLEKKRRAGASFWIAAARRWRAPACPSTGLSRRVRRHGVTSQGAGCEARRICRVVFASFVPGNRKRSFSFPFELFLNRLTFCPPEASVQNNPSCIGMRVRSDCSFRPGEYSARQRKPDASRRLPAAFEPFGGDGLMHI